MVPDPVAAGELQEQIAVEATGGAKVDVLHLGVMAEPGGTSSRLETLLAARRRLALQKKSEPFAMFETPRFRLSLELVIGACQKGLSVGFTTAAALVSEMMEARDERRLIRFQKQMAAYQLLIIDELGFVPLSKTGAELLFELISQRYERGATLITSNLPFDEWTET